MLTENIKTLYNPPLAGARHILNPILLNKSFDDRRGEAPFCTNNCCKLCVLICKKKIIVIHRSPHTSRYIIPIIICSPRILKHGTCLCFRFDIITNTHTHGVRYTLYMCISIPLRVDIIFTIEMEHCSQGHDRIAIKKTVITILELWIGIYTHNNTYHLIRT